MKNKSKMNFWLNTTQMYNFLPMPGSQTCFFKKEKKKDGSVSAWVNKGSMLPWKQIGKKSHGTRMLSRVSSVCHTAHLPSQRTLGLKTWIQILPVTRELCVTQGPVHKGDTNPCLPGSREVLRNQGVWNRDPEILASFFPCFCLSFSLLSSSLSFF